MKKAYFAGGCFWCITPAFNDMDGVISVYCGYSGGEEINPKYEEVKAQVTGHRECIVIEYDENKVGFEELLNVFINSVDPFDGEGQFIDRGFSYTLAVYFNDESEKNTAEIFIKQLEEKSGKKVFISDEKFKTFYMAEEYHQNYYLKNPEEFKNELISSGRIKSDI